MNILVVGVGGQGIVLASKLLAQCAMNRGLLVRTAETIGMAQRGGSVVSHVRVGTQVYSPLIPLGKADVMIALEPGEAVRALPFLKKGGAVVVNKTPIKPVSDTLSKTEYSATEMLAFLSEQVKNVCVVDGDAACATLGSDKVLNLVLLGVAARQDLLEFTTEELLRAVAEKIPEKFRNLNAQALNINTK